MDSRWRHPYGLRLTLRHLMILVVHAALVATMLRGLPRELVTLILPLSPPLLALLVIGLERPGPAKYWLAGFLASLFVPALVAWSDVAMLMIWVSGQVQVDLGLVLLVVLVVNAVGVFSIVRSARRLPGACPDCGLRCFLPLGRRNQAMHWCASCGHVVRTAPARVSGRIG
jgi:hypothetical protein